MGVACKWQGSRLLQVLGNVCVVTEGQGRMHARAYPGVNAWVIVYTESNVCHCTYGDTGVSID